MLIVIVIIKKKNQRDDGSLPNFSQNRQCSPKYLIKRFIHGGKSKIYVTKNKQASNRFHFHHLLIDIFKNVVACKFKHSVPIYRLNKLSYQVVLFIKQTSPLIINVPFFLP